MVHIHFHNKSVADSEVLSPHEKFTLIIHETVGHKFICICKCAESSVEFTNQPD